MALLRTGIGYTSPPVWHSPMRLGGSLKWHLRVGNVMAKPRQWAYLGGDANAVLSPDSGPAGALRGKLGRLRELIGAHQIPSALGGLDGDAGSRSDSSARHEARRSHIVALSARRGLAAPPGRRPLRPSPEWCFLVPTGAMLWLLGGFPTSPPGKWYGIITAQISGQSCAKLHCL